MNHDLFNNGAVGGSYVVSRFRLEYVTPPELRITRIVRASNTGKVTLTWSSVPAANYTIETSMELSTWTAVTPGVVSQGDNTTAEIDATGTTVYFRIRQD